MEGRPIVRRWRRLQRGPFVLLFVALLVLPRTIRTPRKLSIQRGQHLLCWENLHSMVRQSPETVKPTPDSHGIRK
jgi:hypothetical protein